MDKVKVQRLSIPEEIASAFVRSFDGNKDVELILNWYESSIKQNLPDYENVYRNYGQTAKLQLIASMRMYMRESRRLLDENRNKQSNKSTTEQ